MELTPVELRRGRHRMRVDESGITVNRGSYATSWAWDDVVTVGVDDPFESLWFAPRFWWAAALFGRPSLYLCVRGHSRPQHVGAIRFRRRMPTRGPRHAAEDLKLLRERLNGWLDRIDTRGVGHADLGVWWYNQPESRPAPTPQHDPPESVQQHAERLRRELAQLRDNLHQDENPTEPRSP